MIEGQCLCGKVKYQIEGRISRIWLCHCSKCRRATGSAFHASAVCRKKQFRWMSGNENIQEYAETPGYKVRFCITCGSPVPSDLADRDMVFLHAGALAGDPGSRIGHHIFVDSKAAWYEILDGIPAYDEHVPAAEEDA